MPITRGYSRAQRPHLNQVMLEWMVAHHAGIPGLLKPLSGHRSDAQECGQLIWAHMVHLHTTSGATSLVADSALSSAEKLQKLATTRTPWLPRVPAPLSEA
jgi:transposase